MKTTFNNKSYVVAFEGIDGSGKSSIASLLYDRLRDHGVKVALVGTRGAVAGPLVRPEQPGSYAEHALSQLACLIWPSDGAERHHEVGYGYWSGLVAAYFSGLEQGLLPGLRVSYEVVLIENWCFKFAAKLMLKGYDLAALELQLPLAPCLDGVVMIDTPPERAWQRKERFSFVELGGQDGYAPIGRESFIHYQSRIRSQLLKFAGAGWMCLENDDTSLEAITGRIEAVILQRLGAEGDGAA